MTQTILRPIADLLPAGWTDSSAADATVEHTIEDPLGTAEYTIRADGNDVTVEIQALDEWDDFREENYVYRGRLARDYEDLYSAHQSHGQFVFDNDDDHSGFSNERRDSHMDVVSAVAQRMRAAI